MKGMTINLVVKTETGTDEFGAPIYTEELVPVDDCLVGQPTSDDMANALSLYGKKIEFTIGIPKGDTHDWTNKKVLWTDAYGVTHTVQTFGFPITGIEENIPKQLPWHMKVRCADYG